MGKIKDTDFFSLIHDFFKIYLPSQRKSSPHTIRYLLGILSLDFSRLFLCS